MVKHIVIYTLKEGVNKEDTIGMIASLLEPLVGKIPGLKHLEVRRVFQGGMDYACIPNLTAGKHCRFMRSIRCMCRRRSSFSICLTSVSAPTMRSDLLKFQCKITPLRMVFAEVFVILGINPRCGG